MVVGVLGIQTWTRELDELNHIDTKQSQEALEIEWV